VIDIISSQDRTIHRVERVASHDKIEDGIINTACDAFPQSSTIDTVKDSFPQDSLETTTPFGDLSRIPQCVVRNVPTLLLTMTNSTTAELRLSSSP
jgi:hypothetical protein